MIIDVDQFHTLSMWIAGAVPDVPAAPALPIIASRTLTSLTVECGAWMGAGRKPSWGSWMLPWHPEEMGNDETMKEKPEKYGLNVCNYSECGILGDFLKGELGATAIDTFISVTQGIIDRVGTMKPNKYCRVIYYVISYPHGSTIVLWQMAG